MLSRITIALLALPASLAAQTLTEYSLGATTALGTAAATRRLGDAAAERLRKQGGGAVKSATANASRLPANPSPSSSTAHPAATARPARPAGADEAQTSAAIVAPTPASTPPQVPAVTYEDPAGIKEGMDYAEVLRRFGPPSMKLATTAEEQTLCYSGADGNVDAQLREGKIVSVRRTGSSAGTNDLH